MYGHKKIKPLGVANNTVLYMYIVLYMYFKELWFLVSVKVNESVD